MTRRGGKKRIQYLKIGGKEIIAGKSPCHFHSSILFLVFLIYIADQ